MIVPAEAEALLPRLHTAYSDVSRPKYLRTDHASAYRRYHNASVGSQSRARHRRCTICVYRESNIEENHAKQHWREIYDRHGCFY